MCAVVEVERTHSKKAVVVSTVTLAPRAASLRAAVRPANPPPTTTQLASRRSLRRRVARTPATAALAAALAAAARPGAAARRRAGRRKLRAAGGAMKAPAAATSAASAGARTSMAGCGLSFGRVRRAGARPLTTISFECLLYREPKGL